MKRKELIEQLQKLDGIEDVFISVDPSCTYYECGGVRVGFKNPADDCSRSDCCSDVPVSGWEPVVVIGAD